MNDLKQHDVVQRKSSEVDRNFAGKYLTFRLAAQAQQMQEIVAELNKMVKGANAVMESSSSNYSSKKKAAHSFTMKSTAPHGLKDKVHDLVAKTRDHKGQTKATGHKPVSKAQEVIPLEKEEMAEF